MFIFYVNIYTFLQSLLKRLYIYVLIYEITKQLFNIMSFRISNFRAFGPKVVELCVCGPLPGVRHRDFGYLTVPWVCPWSYDTA